MVLGEGRAWSLPPRDEDYRSSDPGGVSHPEGTTIEARTRQGFGRAAGI
jgi:hypothetical protein